MFEFMEKRAEKRAMCEKVDILSIKKRQPSQQLTSGTLRRCIPLFVYNYISLLHIYQEKLFIY